MADVKPFHVIFVIYNQYYKLLGTGFISLWNQWFCFFTYFGLYLGPQKGKSAKSADPDKTLQNAASDQSRHCLQIVYLQSNLNNSNTDGSFTMDNSNSFLSPYEILPIAQANKYFKKIFLFYHEIVCSMYSWESPRRSSMRF